MNSALGTEFATWGSFFVSNESYVSRTMKPGGSPFSEAVAAFKAQLPPAVLRAQTRAAGLFEVGDLHGFDPSLVQNVTD